MTHRFTPLFLFAPLVSPQDPAPLPTNEEWRPLDKIAIQADDEIVTRSSFARFLDRELREREKQGQAVTSQTELQTQISQALRASVTHKLESQAGRDMGLDPREIERIVRVDQADKRQRLGAAGFADELLEEGSVALTFGEDRTEELYQALWRQSIVGGGGASGVRPTTDSYIRPGELRTIYRTNLPDLEGPSEVRLQVVDILSAAAGGVDLSAELAEEVRERALEGEDFGELVLEFSATGQDTLGVTEGIDPRGLIDPGIRRFATESEVGDLSPVLTVTEGERIIGHRVIRLHSKVEGEPAPPFSDQRVQQFLRYQYTLQRENTRLDQARDELRREAFIWIDQEFSAYARALEATPTPEGTPGGLPGPLGMQP